MLISAYKPSYLHCPGTEPLFALTLGQLVQKAAERWGEREERERENSITLSKKY
jgi:hypothetical protein